MTTVLQQLRQLVLLLPLLHDGVAGVSAATPPPSSCDAPTHRGIAFNQDDIKHLIGLKTFQDCCAQCLATEGCRAYTWDPHNCYLKTAPNQPRPNSNSVSSVVGATPCSALPNKTACLSTPSWQSCTWKCSGGISPTCPGKCEQMPPPPPPPPPPCKDITKQGECTKASCVWNDGHCVAPAPPPPPIPVSKRTWLNPADPPALRAQRLLQVMTVEEKLHMWAGNGTMFPYVGAVTAIPRLGVPPLHLNDGPQGFRGQGNSKPGRPLLDQTGTTTAFPSGLTIAATWDVEAARMWGEAMGEEFRDKGSNVQLGPGLCVSRLPNNGRNFEYMSGECVPAIRARSGSGPGRAGPPRACSLARPCPLADRRASGCAVWGA
jgi:hypothetical protein